MAIFYGVIFLLLGLWMLMEPIDSRWARRERNLRSQGLSPQRTPEWEQGVKTSGCILLAGGLAFVMIGVIAHSSTPQPMSNMSVMGRQLTRAEAEACGNNIEACAMQEAIRNPSSIERNQ